MRRVSIAIAFLSVCAGVLCAAPREASAFVSPGWREASLHRGILGEWELVDVRGKSMSFDATDKSLRLEIGTTTLRATFDEATKDLSYQTVIDEDGMISLTAFDETGALRVTADVLLETPDAMTIYLLEGDDDIGVAMHFERVR